MDEVPFRRMLGTMLVLPLGLGACADVERAPRAIPDVSDRRTEVPRSVGATVLADAPAEPSRADPSSIAPGTPETAFRGPATIPAGTIVRARLDHGISPRSHGSGDRVLVTVADEVLAPDGMVLVPEGARLMGTVQWPGGTGPGARSDTDGPRPVDEATGSTVGAGPAFQFERLLVSGGYLALKAAGVPAEEQTTDVSSDSEKVGAVAAGSIIVVEVREAVPLAPR